MTPQAAKTATQTRETINSGLDADELERNFVIIEIFLSTFRDDENVLRAAIELVVCILAAVKQGIVFFWMSQRKRLPVLLVSCAWSLTRRQYDGRDPP